MSGARFRAQSASRRALELSRSVEKQRVEELEEKKEDLKRKREEKAKRKAINDLKSTTYQEVRRCDTRGCCEPPGACAVASSRRGCALDSIHVARGVLVCTCS